MLQHSLLLLLPPSQLPPCMRCADDTLGARPQASHLMWCQLVAWEEWVCVHAAWVAEVLPPLQLNIVHGKELEGQQTNNVEWQLDLGGGIIPEDVGADNLLWTPTQNKKC